jgi:hypothetical protein
VGYFPFLKIKSSGPARDIPGEKVSKTKEGEGEET